MRLTLDRLALDPAVAAEHLTGRLRVPILSIVIDDVDFVRETTRVSVRYPIDDSVWRWTAPTGESEQLDS
jgi:hypothetical protein